MTVDSNRASQNACVKNGDARQKQLLYLQRRDQGDGRHKKEVPPGGNRETGRQAGVPCPPSRDPRDVRLDETKKKESRGGVGSGGGRSSTHQCLGFDPSSHPARASASARHPDLTTRHGDGFAAPAQLGRRAALPLPRDYARLLRRIRVPLALDRRPAALDGRGLPLRLLHHLARGPSCTTLRFHQSTIYLLLLCCLFDHHPFDVGVRCA